MAAKQRGFLREAWSMAWPYWRSEEKWSAGARLGTIIALNLFAVWLSVRLNSWNRDFYNALQQYNWDEFWRQFAIFGVIAAAWIVVAVYSLYLRQGLQMRWRRWLTHRFLEHWLEAQAYYRIQLDLSVTDNPDQRISDDLNRYTATSLSLSVGLLNAVVTLLSFLSILWALSGTLVIPLGHGSHIAIPGYMVVAAFVYAIIGTWLTQRIGFPLVGLMFSQQRLEADFRFSMVRLRENAESVAFYGGEERELVTFRDRVERIVDNWWAIIRRQKKLTWFTTGYSQVAIVFPYLVASPRYFGKQIALGGLMQIASAFGQVQDSLSFIITSYTDIAEYQSVVQRLSGFRHRIIEIGAQRREPQPIAIDRSGEGVEVSGLHLNLPSGESLRDNLALAAQPGHPVLVTGPSGAGKSTLLRAIAGLWPYGRGRIRVGGGSALFLPQRPYLPLGTLADALAYPALASSYGQEALEAALDRVGLGPLVEHLYEEGNWAQSLSGGEQQRLGFARVLLTRPEIVFLDEATSALDEPAEAALYRMLREAEWHPTIVSVGHRSTLQRFHDQIVDLGQPKISEAAAS